MPSIAGENAPKIDRVELAKLLLEKSERQLARARNWHKKRSYGESMRQAIHSIEHSTQVMRLLLGMEYEHELPGSAWFGQLVGAFPPEHGSDKDAERLKRLAGELFHTAKIALDRSRNPDDPTSSAAG